MLCLEKSAWRLTQQASLATVLMHLFDYAG